MKEKGDENLESASVCAGASGAASRASELRKPNRGRTEANVRRDSEHEVGVSAVALRSDPITGVSQEMERIASEEPDRARGRQKRKSCRR